MCGINGIIAKQGSSEAAKSSLSKMNDALSHRGPDASGIWSEGNVHLGHRRLSIIDLSDAGTQPMISQDQRFVIVYNGELYNFKELKFELQRAAQGETAYFFKTSTDTEVILAAYAKWGKECLKKMNGMFAFSIWDKLKKELFIARDRLGIKPLYYYHSDKIFTFSSEIRAIIKSESIPASLNKDALVDYLRYQTVHAPATMIKEVFMLLPGHHLTYHNGKIEIEQWWNSIDFAKKQENKVNYEEAKTEVKKIFLSAVEKRLVADVPFGAFLSGGIDSTAVVGAMSQFSSEKVKTFNVSFGETEFSEEKYARLVADKFGTEHHQINLSPEHFLNELPHALDAMDHPSGDGPNSYIVSQATKNAGITMALSGLGGDELFCGYDIFTRIIALEKQWWLNFIPRPGRALAGEIIKLKQKGISGQKIANILSKPRVDFDYVYPVSRELYADALVRGLTNRSVLPMNEVYKFIRTHDLPKAPYRLSAISIVEMSTYMQNVLLRDTDQMSMASALEVRVPFLDYRLVEYVLGLPDEIKYPHTQKKLLVDALKEFLPDEIVNRPKMGFVLPWQQWMKNELKEFCENNLTQLGKSGVLNQNVVSALWQRFLSGDPNITWSRIWPMVVLNYWIVKNKVNID